MVITFGLTGHNGRMSIMVPRADGLNKRWTTSETLTALHTLSVASLSKALWTVGDNANACIQVVSHVISEIPVISANYVNPSLSFLVRYWHDQTDDVMHSARSIFISAVDRLSYQQCLDLAASWGMFLSKSVDKKSKSLAVLVLGILGSEKADSLDPVLSKRVANAILEIIFHESNVQLRIAAIELLGKGFQTWFKYITDVSGVVLKLFKLSVITEPKALALCSHHALMIIGTLEPMQFLQALGNKIRNPTPSSPTKNSGSGSSSSSTTTEEMTPMEQSKALVTISALVKKHPASLLSSSSSTTTEEMTPMEQSKALVTISALVKKHPASLLSSLPILVEAIVRSLDPHVPYLRNACLKAATNLVHELVLRFPMVAFHQESQRLAVGDKKGPLYIYDLISATRWYTLEGHKAQVSALAFSGDGKILASYAIAESRVALWKISNSFFGILGASSSCYKAVVVSPTHRAITTALLLEATKMQWIGPRDFLLIRTWEEEATRISI
eukprot:TRINITY_DN508_c0_g1_i7.p1 TRINITY_DN508_c0_g1~~TRINITY_DN508_c0_g1_i7.p1  ORF type:complete len:502 (+),score=81.33 TRINITY_DN508_c0_g1_i7:2702-4207(+)